MIQHQIGDLFESNADVIAHQVNCRGVMGSGVAKQVKSRFPDTFNMYKAYASHNSARSLLGKALLLVENKGDDKVCIANLFSQLDYGHDKKCYTDYHAFRLALQDMKNQLNLFPSMRNRELRIAMPYRIGCDRGGGDWNTVYQIIEEELGDYDVTLWELPKNQ